MSNDGELWTYLLFWRNSDDGPDDWYTKDVKKFARLPNVNGQKYTMGDKYRSREEQGEFIFLSLVYKPSPRRPECEIQVENETYFISPTYGDSAVFVNGADISTRTELKFGDNFSLGDEGNTFWFREVGWKEEKRNNAVSTTSAGNPVSDKLLQIQHLEDVEATSRVEFTPGQNGLILSKILSFLHLYEVQRARFVAKIWAHEGLRLLQKRAKFFINLDRGYRHPCESIMLFRYVLEMGHSPMQNVKIALPGLGSMQDYSDTSPGTTGAKLVDDLNYFLLDPNPQIKLQFVKRFEWDGPIVSKLSCEIIQRLLQIMADTLEELTLAGYWYVEDDVWKDYPFPVTFKKLRVLVFSLDTYGSGDDVDNARITPWLKQLMTGIQGVTTIRLHCSDDLSLIFLKLVHENQFPNLNAISHPRLNLDVIQILLQLNKPLKKLELGFTYSDVKKEGFFAFDRLLAKYAQTLEWLEIVIPRSCWLSEDAQQFPVFINFPAFPNLQYLSVGSSELYLPSTPCIRFAFPNGRRSVNYEQDLPNLKSLRLWSTRVEVEFEQELMYTDDLESIDSENVWGGMYAMFFPGMVDREEVEVCATLQQLEVFHSLYSWFGIETKLLSAELEPVIAKMFPNVANEWINAIRERGANNVFSGPRVESHWADGPVGKFLKVLLPCKSFLQRLQLQ